MNKEWCDFRGLMRGVAGVWHVSTKLEVEGNEPSRCHAWVPGRRKGQCKGPGVGTWSRMGKEASEARAE